MPLRSAHFASVPCLHTSCRFSNKVGMLRLVSGSLQPLSLPSLPPLLPPTFPDSLLALASPFAYLPLSLLTAASLLALASSSSYILTLFSSPSQTLKLASHIVTLAPPLLTCSHLPLSSQPASLPSQRCPSPSLHLPLFHLTPAALSPFACTYLPFDACTLSLPIF
jgi:hypothetical protein